MSRIKCNIAFPAHFGRLPEITEDEEDMLDLAFDLQKTSRLGCQIIITDDLDGLTGTLPGETRSLLF
jgi:2Fe-2S ferredoxin